MKWLIRLGGALVGVVVLAVVVLLALGAREGAGLTRVTVEIDRPPAVVFRWISEPDRLKQWISWVVEVRMISVTPEKVGSKELFVMNDPNMKEPVMVEVETTAYEQDRHVAAKLTMPMGFTGTVDYRLTDRGGKTLLEYENRYEFNHWLARLMEPLVSPQARAKVEGDLATLKRLVEAEPPAPPAAAADTP